MEFVRPSVGRILAGGVLGILLVLAGPQAQAAFLADRPLNTDGIDTPDARQWEFSLGADGIFDKSTGDRSVTPIGVLAYGLTPVWDLELSIPVSFLSPMASAAASGLGDVTIGTQLRFMESSASRPGLALAFSAKLPTGNSANGLGTGMTDLGVELIATQSVGPASVSANAIYTLLGKATGAATGDRLGYTVSAGVPVNSALTVVCELVGTSVTTPAAAGTLSYLIGFSWQGADFYSLDVGYGSQFSPTSDGSRWTTGFTAAF